MYIRSQGISRDSQQIIVHKIEEMINEFKIGGKDIYNLSNWNIDGEAYKILEGAPIQKHSSACGPNYIFQYNLADRRSISSRLGFSSNRVPILANNNTISITASLVFLKNLGIRRVYIVESAYFSVESICKSLEIEVKKISIDTFKNIPSSGIMPQVKSKKTAFWITNPIIGNSFIAMKPSLSADIIHASNKISGEGSFVVFDECLARRENYISHLAKNEDFIISILSPMKSICMNSNKFSIMIYGPKHGKTLSFITDSVFGSLSSSIFSAASFYLSDDFDLIEKKFYDLVSKNCKEIKNILEENEWVMHGDGSSCYYSLASSKKIDTSEVSYDLIKEFMGRFGYGFIPLASNHQNRKGGNAPPFPFSFKINLAMDINLLGNGLRSFLSFMDSNRFYHKNVIRKNDICRRKEFWLPDSSITAAP